MVAVSNEPKMARGSILVCRTSTTMYVQIVIENTYKIRIVLPLLHVTLSHLSDVFFFLNELLSGSSVLG